MVKHIQRLANMGISSKRRFQKGASGNGADVVEYKVSPSTSATLDLQEQEFHENIIQREPYNVRKQNFENLRDQNYGMNSEK